MAAQSTHPTDIVDVETVSNEEDAEQKQRVCNGAFRKQGCALLLTEGPIWVKLTLLQGLDER